MFEAIGQKHLPISESFVTENFEGLEKILMTKVLPNLILKLFQNLRTWSRQQRESIMPQSDKDWLMQGTLKGEVSLYG